MFSISISKPSALICAIVPTTYIIYGKIMLSLIYKSKNFRMRGKEGRPMRKFNNKYDYTIKK